MKKKIKKTKTSSSPSPVSSDFHVAVSKIAVTHICHSIGYKSFEKTALETLTSITIKYLQTLASSAATSAASSGRTHSNLYDVIISLHHLHSHIGYNGNSKPNTSLTDSSLLIGLMNHVNRTREVPFAKRLPRGTLTEPVFSACESSNRSRDVSFPRGTHSDEVFSGCKNSESGDRIRQVLFAKLLPHGTHRDKVFTLREMRHVPRWLPDFPEVKESGENMSVTVVKEGKKDKKEVCLDREVSELPKIRRKVSFKIGEKAVLTAVNEGKNMIDEVKIGGDLRSGVCKLGKRILCDVYGNEKTFVNDSKTKMIMMH